MSSTSRKARKGSISYREVDSDEDVELEDQSERGETKSMGSLGVIKKTVGDTYGSLQATKCSKKRSRKSQKAVEEEENKEGSVYDSKLLSKMPFDIFAETCSHLEGTDLINLAQVNKSFRQTLLSKAARSIWIARRKADGYPLPDETTELELATLVYGSRCQNCGTQVSFLHESLSLQLRHRACKKCRRQLQIRGQTMKATWKDLHAEAVNCVIYDSEKWWTGRTHFTYLVSDLDEVDHVLKDLQEEDENILSSLESLKYRSGTRSRDKQSSTLPVADHVSSYVKSRQELVREHGKFSQELIAAAKKKETERLKVARDEFDKVKEKFCKISLLLKTDAGWSDEEVGEFWNGSWGIVLDAAFKVPEESPCADSQAWSDCRRVVADKIVRDGQQNLETTRWQQLYDYYSTFAATIIRSSNSVTLFPTRFEFMNLPDIVPLWKPADCDTSTEALIEALPSFAKALEKYQVDARILAIRSIVAANRGIAISKLSEDPTAYSETVYDSTFFALATSQFSSWSYGTPRKLLPFPEVLQVNSSAGLRHLERCIDTRQVGLIRLMLEVAGLDPSVTSWKDLVRFGERFIWINAPIRKKRNRKEIYDCFGLLEAIRRRGPSKAKLKAGHVVEIGITENESDGEESDSDDSSEDEGSSDEEEDEEDEDDA